MNKSILPVVIVLAITIPLIAWQQSENRQLKQDLAAAKVERERTLTRFGEGSETRLSHARRSSGEKRPGGFSEKDLLAALGDTDPVSRLGKVLAYAEAVSADEIPFVLESLRQLMGKGKEYDLLEHVLLARWAQSDPDAAYACLSDFSYKSRGWSSSSLLSSLTAMDPRRAADWVSDPANEMSRYGKYGSRMAEIVAGEWMRQDPDAAFAWAKTLPEAQQGDALAAVISQIGRSDPQQATSMLATLEPGRVRSEVVGELAEAWARNSPSEAATWAESLEGGERSQAIREVVDEWAKLDPAAAAGYLDRLAGGESIDSYVRDVASRWARQEPADAAGWVMAQSEGNGTRDAMGYVMWNWTRQDPEAAATWLLQQPAGPNRDGGIAGLSKASGSFDPAAATQWAHAISDERRRNQMLNHSLERWVEQDANAAMQWAETNGVELPHGK
ncbi:hypothetical protein HW115_02730 [Verrucomicrobiaceae bacterium N1E253]|uniref:Uncharacterized protein n=1 Tax=Oceaniferula marina TaxID=2748318 RepID=A0A851GIP6_9BACT|nr:hypothetical protein [Oceaniferula marina]NWK54510.1 hypothetical protein [Oceaniferula marina]